MKKLKLIETYGIRIVWGGVEYWYEGWNEEMGIPIVGCAKTPKLTVDDPIEKKIHRQWRKVYEIRNKHPELFGFIYPKAVSGVWEPRK